MELARLAKLRAVFLGARRSAPQENEADPRAAAETVLLQDDSTQTHKMKQAEAPRTAVQPAIRDGTVLSGRFRITRFIGRGGMGEVYEAEDLELGGRVALKTIRPGLLQDGHAVARFRREIQLSRQVTHKNICRVFDVGHDELDGRDLLFLTMEYLEGETLTSYLARNGSVPEAMALALGRQIAAGLDALHERGVVHRDLKPGNVMLRTSDSGAQRAVIMDFGLAREFQTEAAETVLTRQGVVLGTPAYMAPEQMSGQSVTPASDVYSFGLVLYEMLTGRKARPGLQKPGQTGLPARWEAVVLRCLEIDADARPKSASQALDGLDGPARKPPRWLAFGALALALGAAVPFLAPAWLERRAGSSVVGTGTGSVNDDILRARELLVRYFEPRNIVEAIRILEKIVRSQPGHAGGHAALAAAYWLQYNNTGKTEFIDHARVSATQAINLDPDLAGPHVTLGAIFTETGRTDLAGAELRRALQLDGRNPEAYQTLAELYRKQGRNDEIEPAIQKAIDLAPGDWRPRNWLAQHYRQTGQTEKAIEQLQAAAKLTPDNPLIYNNLGAAYVKLYRLADARAAFERSLELDERPRTLANLGVVYFREAEYAKAAEMYQRALRMNPDSYLAWANLASAHDLSSGGKPAAREFYLKAIALAEEARTKTPLDAMLLANLASYYAAVGDREKGVPLIRQALALNPSSPDVANRAAEAYEILRDRSEALRWIETALALGYSLDDVKRNPDLAGLRGDPRFTKIESQQKER